MKVVRISRKALTKDDLFSIANFKAHAIISENSMKISKKTFDILSKKLKGNELIYGVSTNYGAMAGKTVKFEHALQLQRNLVKGLGCGMGNFLSKKVVRLAMAIRLKTLSYGASGIRPEILERTCTFLNNDLIPLVPELGSIGASGDLIPSSYVAGCLAGYDEYYLLDENCQKVSAKDALKQMNLKEIDLLPKEGLALMNGTAFSTALGLEVISEYEKLFKLSLGVHSILIQGLTFYSNSFNSFPHELKPHNGQIKVAAFMKTWLEDSQFSRKTKDMKEQKEKENLIQDRYSIRCLPQFLGPVYDNFEDAMSKLMVEANSITDNPLFKLNKEEDDMEVYHQGNFLSSYVSEQLDNLRTSMGMVAKHMGAQISLISEPSFNNGLPGSFTQGYHNHDFGLKGVEILHNSLETMVMYYSNPIRTMFPTHAEQFNQNINSQSMNAALITKTQLDHFRKLISTSLFLAVQSIQVRMNKVNGDYKTNGVLSKKSEILYNQILKVMEIPKGTPLRDTNGTNENLDVLINKILKDINNENSLILSVFKEK